jgi:phosphate/sulfate permease
VTVLLFVVLVLVLAAEFVNGWHDASNAIATVVSTRVLSPRVAVLMATVFNAVGAFSGTAVAATVGKGIVDPQAINLVTVASAMVAIVVWEFFPWYYGLPTSASHALVAGLSGARLAAGGGRMYRARPAARHPAQHQHTINTAIMGVGASRRFSAERWGVVGDVVTAWVLTFPVCGAIGWLVAQVLARLVSRPHNRRWWSPFECTPRRRPRSSPPRSLRS